MNMLFISNQLLFPFPIQMDLSDNISAQPCATASGQQDTCEEVILTLDKLAKNPDYKEEPEVTLLDFPDIKSCYIHNTPVSKYCQTCKVLLCPNCLSNYAVSIAHIDHKIVGIEEPNGSQNNRLFLMYKKEHLDVEDDIKQCLPHLEKSLESGVQNLNELIKEKNQISHEFLNNIKEMKQSLNAIGSIKDLIAQKIKEIPNADVAKFISESTSGLIVDKRHIQTILNQEAKFIEIIKFLNEHKRNLDGQRWTHRFILYAKANVDKLEALISSSSDSTPINGNLETLSFGVALHELKVLKSKGVKKAPEFEERDVTISQLSYDIDTYCSFRGANNMKFVAAAAKMPLNQVLDFMVSDPFKVKIPTSKGGEVYAEVSDEADLIWTNSANKTLNLFNLKTHTRATIESFPQECFLAIYNNKLHIGKKRSDKLLVALIKDVYSSQSTKVFLKHNIIAVENHVARTDISQQTGEVLYTNKENNIVSLDLRTFKCDVKTKAGLNHNIASFTGINIPRINCVTHHHDGTCRRVNVVRYDWESLQLGEIRRGIEYVIPSVSEPCNITSGVTIDYDRNVYNGEKGKTLRAPFVMARLRSLVRIFQDIFLAHTEEEGWVACRIVVP